MAVIGKKFEEKLIFIFLVYYTLKEINTFIYYDIKIINPPFIGYLIDYFFIGAIVINFKNNKQLINNHLLIEKYLKIYSLFFVILFILSLLNSENNYWDYKFIFITFVPFIFFYLAFILGYKIDNIKYLIKIYSKYFFPISILLFIFIEDLNPELISRLLIPLSLLFLFFRYINIVTKMMMLLLSFIIIFYDESYRLNIFNIIFSFSLIILFYLNFKKVFIYKTLFYLIIFFPVILIIASLYFNFDFFLYISNLFKSDFSPNLTANTRSFLYIETYNSINSLKDLLFGQGLNASYISDFFSKNSSLIFAEGRFRSEVGFLNLILKTGILGFILYSLIFILPSYLGIVHSSNIVSKILSLKLMSYWLLLFIEFYQQVNVSYFIIYFVSGLLMSKKFRSFDEIEIKNFLKK
jgi:hypothetical protein